MSDYAAEWTDKQIAALERRIRSIYSQAKTDTDDKILDFWQKFEKKDAKHREELKKGIITKADYQDWLRGQAFQGKQWDALKERMVQGFTDADKIAYSIVHDTQDDVFATNANYMAYSIESDLGINYGFGIQNKETVKHLLASDETLLPRKYIKNSENRRYVSTIIDKYVAQGILQGEPLRDVAKRILNGVAGTEMRYCMVNARTAMTCAQNAGRQYTLDDAVERLGIEVQKKWSSSGDEHVRESHQEIDGEIVDYDKPFSNGLMYPGDPHGAPAEVYNCRCALGEVVKGLKKGAVAAAKSGKGYKQWLKDNKNGSLNRVDDGIIEGVFYTHDDPMLEVTGAAEISNPKEIQAFRDEVLAITGTPIDERENVGLYYSPGLSKGKPGQVHIQKGSSYSAWKHEMQHFYDDRDAGWSGMAIISNPKAVYLREQRAYAIEIELAKKAGRKDIVKRLRDNRNKERMRINGELENITE